MKAEEASSLRTRSSLINRLKNEDADGWNEFYRIYGKVVRDFAVKAGLTPFEADDVVQETAIGLARNFQSYTHNRRKCRFKTFLLQQASWRILDQFKKRNRAAFAEPLPMSDDTGTSVTERIPDPHPTDLQELFETEWREKLYAEALLRIQKKFTLKQFQVFDLLVVKEWSAAEVSASLGMTPTNLYVTRYRMSAALKKEIKRLEKEFDQMAQRQARSLS